MPDPHVKIPKISEGTLGCGIAVVYTFELYFDKDDKINHNIETIFYRDVGCGHPILTSHPNKHQDILLEQFGESFVHL